MNQAYQRSTIPQKSLSCGEGQTQGYNMEEKKSSQAFQEAPQRKRVVPFHWRQTIEVQHKTPVSQQNQASLTSHLMKATNILPWWQIILEWQIRATVMPSVSGVIRWGGTGWFNYKALDEPYKAHFACTCIRPEVNRLLFVRLNFK